MKQDLGTTLCCQAEKSDHRPGGHHPAGCRMSICVEGAFCSQFLTVPAPGGDVVARGPQSASSACHIKHSFGPNSMNDDALAAVWPQADVMRMPWRKLNASRWSSSTSASL